MTDWDISAIEEEDGVAQLLLVADAARDFQVVE
jgi:hypothetical protein